MMICCAAHLVNIFLIISFIVFLSNKMAGTFCPKYCDSTNFNSPPNYLFEEYIPLSNVGNKLWISKAKPNMSALRCIVANTFSQGQGSGTQTQNPNKYLASLFKMKDQVTLKLGLTGFHYIGHRSCQQLKLLTTCTLYTTSSYLRPSQCVLD